MLRSFKDSNQGTRHGNYGLNNGRLTVFYILCNKLCSASLKHMCAARFSPVSKYGSVYSLLENMPVRHCSIHHFRIQLFLLFINSLFIKGQGVVFDVLEALWTQLLS